LTEVVVGIEVVFTEVVVVGLIVVVVEEVV
jgi:hypothetical protein